MNRNVPVPFLGEGQRQRWPLTRLRAVVTSGSKSGTYIGRVAVRATGSFNITTKRATIEGINSRYCTTLHKNDGYSYGPCGLPSLSAPEKGRSIPYVSR